MLYSNRKNIKNVLSDDIFYTTLSYYKFILELHLKNYTRIRKQIRLQGLHIIKPEIR
jgi:hypothetical protein